MLFNIPNLITIGRIALIPVLVLCFQAMKVAGSAESLWTWSWVATLLFSLAGFSDLVDGYYARRYGQVSTAGKFFDPMADKLIHMTTMVMKMRPAPHNFFIR